MCGDNKLIPDSMKLHDNGNEPLKATEYVHPFPIFQSEFRGRKVAVKIVRLYGSQKLDEPLRVSTHPPKTRSKSYDSPSNAWCRDFAKKLSPGNTSGIQTFSRSWARRYVNTDCA